MSASHPDSSAIIPEALSCLLSTITHSRWYIMVYIGIHSCKNPGCFNNDWYSRASMTALVITNLNLRIFEEKKYWFMQLTECRLIIPPDVFQLELEFSILEQLAYLQCLLVSWIREDNLLSSNKKRNCLSRSIPSFGSKMFSKERPATTTVSSSIVRYINRRSCFLLIKGPSEFRWNKDEEQLIFKNSFLLQPVIL